MAATQADGCTTLIGGIFLLFIAYFVILYVVLPGTLLLGAAGIAWGGGHAVKNYFHALAANIKPERPWIP